MFLLKKRSYYGRLWRPASNGMNRVVVLSLKKKFKKLEFKIQTLGRELLKAEKKDGFYFEVYLVDRAFMNKNVLAFPAPRFFNRPDIKQKNLGEIYLNPDYIRNEKLEIRNKELNFDKKLRYLLIHGFLHLLGYGHKKKGDTIIMQRKEAKLLSKFRN